MHFRMCQIYSIGPKDGQDLCLLCLSIQHTEAAFVEALCSHCKNMTLVDLRRRVSSPPLLLPSTANIVSAKLRKDDLRTTVLNGLAGMSYES